MAGGQGVRLRPLTCERPKPMVPILNRPVIEHLVRLLKRHGISDIIITAHYKPGLIQSELGDGKSLGVQLTYIVEETPLGTAGCVKQVERLLDGTFLVISGDALTDFPLDEAVKRHREVGAVSTLIVTEVEDPSPYGIVSADERGRIIKFLEKPRPEEVFSRIINTGIYVLEPDVLRYCPPAQPFDFSRDLFPKLLEANEPIYTHRATGYWSDIGNCDQYIRSQIDALYSRVRLDGLPETETPGLWIEPKAKIHPSAVVTPPVVIGAGAVVEAGASVGPGVVLGRKCRVGEGAQVEGSIIWEESRIGKHAVVNGAVVGRRSLVGPYAKVMEGAAVGDEAHIYAKAVVQAGGRVWAAAQVSPAQVSPVLG